MSEYTESALTGRFGGIARSIKQPGKNATTACLVPANITTPRRHRVAVYAIAGLISFAAAGAALVYRDYHTTLSSAFARTSSGSQIAHTPCGPIEYADSGEGKPVLVVHGTGGGFDQSRDVGASLVHRGYRIIAVSRFGYLRTPMPEDASPAAQGDAHACLLDALNIPRAAIVAASAGATSALQLAIRHPDRVSSLVLMAPAAYVPRPDGSPSLHISETTKRLLNTAVSSDFVYWAATRLTRPILIRSLLATSPEMLEGAEEKERQRANRVLETAMPISERRDGMLNDVRIVTSLERYPIERIKAPTLIFSAADDAFGTYDAAKYTAAGISGARFVGFKTGGHLAVGHEQEVLGEMLRFLK